MKRFIALFLCLIIVCIPAASFAHSGGTDANGGHYDSDTGEYHYHHGYPAHKHPNGVCPYSESANSASLLANTSNNDPRWEEVPQPEHDFDTGYNKDSIFEQIYYEGYDEGYYQGYSELETYAYKQYDEGYETGYDEGYKKAERIVPSWCLTVMFFLIVAIVELAKKLRKTNNPKNKPDLK